MESCLCGQNAFLQSEVMKVHCFYVLSFLNLLYVHNHSCGSSQRVHYNKENFSVHPNRCCSAKGPPGCRAEVKIQDLFCGKKKRLLATIFASPQSDSYASLRRLESTHRLETTLPRVGSAVRVFSAQLAAGGGGGGVHAHLFHL